MWLKLFDWLRLFERTAIYPILLKEVFVDIGPFILMMLVILGFFGNGLYIFSAITAHGGSAELYEDRLSLGILSSLVSEVLIMVG